MKLSNEELNIIMISLSNVGIALEAASRQAANGTLSVDVVIPLISDIFQEGIDALEKLKKHLL